MVNEVVSLYKPTAELKEIRINNYLPILITAWGDKDMVGTILRNLVSNAIKFTFPNGAVSISGESNNTETIIRITDSGIGIPEKAIEKLFRIDSKYSTPGTQDEQGTGLGLILCKDFVDKHNGKIWVESINGEGATFIFTLPHQIFR